MTPTPSIPADQLPGTVAQVLGFTPRDAVCMMILPLQRTDTGAQQRMLGPIVHVDAPAVASPAAAADMAAAAARHGGPGAAVILVTFGTHPVLTTLTEALRALAIPTLQVVNVPADAPAPAPPPILAAHDAFTGRVTAASRDEYMSRTAYDPAAIPTPEAAAILPLTPDGYTELLRAASATTYNRPLLAALCDAARVTPPADPTLPELMTVLATAALRAGDGATARAAIERGLAAHPRRPATGSLLRTLLQVTEQGIAPADFPVIP